MAKSEVSKTQRVLNVWAVILILWSLYRVTFKTDLPIWIDEFIAKPILFLLPMYWFIVKYEKKGFLQGVSLKTKHMRQDVLFGLGLGLLYVLLALGVRLIKTSTLPEVRISASSFVWVLSILSASVSEQLVSTGFVFSRLKEESTNLAKPILYSAILFFFLHVPVLFGVEKIATGTLVQMITMNTVLSIMTSIVFVMKKNTIAPILIQTLYLLSLPILL